MDTDAARRYISLLCILARFWSCIFMHRSLLHRKNMGLSSRCSPGIFLFSLYFFFPHAYALVIPLAAKRDHEMRQRSMPRIDLSQNGYGFCSHLYFHTLYPRSLLVLYLHAPESETPKKSWARINTMGSIFLKGSHAIVGTWAGCQHKKTS